MIENMIYEIRNTQVMLDSDLAKLYECKNGTKSINLTVKRHIDRFPIRFMFQLSDREMNELRFQLETSISRGRRYNPYVFTEQGVAMLSTILKTDVAVQVSISIMDAFVNMRKYIGNNLIEQKYINNQVLKNTDDLKKLNESFSKFEAKRKTNEIYFNGMIYDAYSKIIDIMNESKKKLLL